MKWLLSIFIGLLLVVEAGAQGLDPFAAADGRDRGERAHDPFDPDLNRPRQVRIQVEYVQLRLERYLELMKLKRESADATAIRKRLQEMVEEDEAKVLETTMVVARSGERAFVESITEFIYPTEYQPPSLPGNGGPSLSPEQSSAKRLRRMLRIPVTPTSFETRNLGSVLQVSPNIGARARVIDLKFAPERVIFCGNSVHHEEEDFDGRVNQIRHPLIAKQSVNTAITCIDGQYNLVTALTPLDEDGDLDRSQKVMVFVKCDVLVVKEGEK